MWYNKPKILSLRVITNCLMLLCVITGFKLLLHGITECFSYIFLLIPLPLGNVITENVVFFSCKYVTLICCY